LEEILARCESAVGRLRTVEMTALRELDRRQVPIADGCRSLGDWVTGRLDVAPDTARELVSTARRLEELPAIEQAAADGVLTYDRTVAVARLADAGDGKTALDESAGLDVAGINRQVAQRRRLTRNQEHRGFRERYVATQSNLDHTALDFHGRMVGVAGRVLEEALHSVGDQLPATPGPGSRSTRNADALWKMAQDALTGSNGDADAASTYGVTVFVDANEAATNGGETGIVIESGPRVGPATLEALICAGSVEVTAVTKDSTPLNIGRRSRVVPPKLRRFVLHRDHGACTADGCTSRYRLEAHHIIPWSHGGTTDADNLTTLCWYHHHVVIHGEGFTIDPQSPPCRRRFIRPRHHDPP
jgi:hypothetical protein